MHVKAISLLIACAIFSFNIWQPMFQWMGNFIELKLIIYENSVIFQYSFVNACKKAKRFIDFLLQPDFESFQSQIVLLQK